MSQSKLKKMIPVQRVLPALFSMRRRFAAQIRPQRTFIAASLLSLLISVGARLLEPWPLMMVFDFVVLPAKSSEHPLPVEWLGALLSEYEGYTQLALISGGLVLIVFVRASFGYMATVGMTLAASRFATAVRARLFEHLQILSLSFHQRVRSGDLTTRLTHDVERLRDAVSLSVVPLIANTLIVTTILGMMFWVNVELTLLSLAFVPMLFLMSFRSSARIQNLVRAQRRQDGELASTAAEAILAVKVVQALSLERIMGRIFRRNNETSFSSGARTQRVAAAVERAVEVIMAVATAAILWRGAGLVMTGEMTAGTLLLFVSYMTQLMVPLRQSAKNITRLSRALVSSERIAEIFDVKPAVVERRDAVHLSPFRKTIRFENVQFRHTRAGWALSDIDIVIRAGERVAFVGNSGAGKSTLLDLLLRLHDPNEGRITIDGVDIRGVTLESLRSQMGVVLQDSVLFGVSIIENIRYGHLGASDAEVIAAARLADVHDFIASLPQGYDTIAGERGAALSGGQRQRIALARALVRRAPILLLDEPATGLDAKSHHEVMTALQHCWQDVTTLLVTHDLQSVREFDHIYFIDAGRVVEQGTHAELYAAQGVYWRLYSRQSSEQGAQVTSLSMRRRKEAGES